MKIAFGFFSLLLIFSNAALANVDYTNFKGVYTFVSGTGKNAEECRGEIRVDVQPTKKQITLFQLLPVNGNGFITNFSNIDNGPTEDGGQPAEPTYFNLSETKVSGTIVESSIRGYYKGKPDVQVELYGSSLVLAKNVLVFQESYTKFEYPDSSFSRVCTFVKK